MTKLTLIQGKYGYANNRDFKRLFGLSPDQHWPKGGIPARIIQGVKVWVKPAQAPVEHKYYSYHVQGTVTGIVKKSNHRVMAECPHCQQVMSAGRMHQHVCKKGR